MSIKKASILLSRLALFVIYFWFGILKIIGQSPASPMVHNLLSKTLPFMPFGVFIIIFGLFEVVIGILFVTPGAEKWALSLFAIHMILCTMPLFFMPEVWTKIFVPTLEGQYIIKNLALIACAVTIWSNTITKKML